MPECDCSFQWVTFEQRLTRVAELACRKGVPDIMCKGRCLRSREELVWLPPYWSEGRIVKIKGVGRSWRPRGRCEASGPWQE